MKQAMIRMADICQKDFQKMMTEMMPVCMDMMKSRGMAMNTDMMRVMMKTMMGNPG